MSSRVKRRKTVAEYVGHIPLTEHERMHGLMYTNPLDSLRYNDYLHPLPCAMVLPEDIGDRVHHYDVRFAYEGALRNKCTKEYTAANPRANTF